MVFESDESEKENKRRGRKRAYKAQRKVNTDDHAHILKELGLIIWTED